MLLLGVYLAWASTAWADRPSDLWTPQTKTATATTAQTDTTLWTPASGKRFHLQGCAISSDGAVRVELEVSNTDVIPPISLASSGTEVISAGGALLYSSATDALLTYSTSITGVSGTHRSVSVLCWGYESQ